MAKVKKAFRSKITNENLNRHEYFDFKNLSITQIIATSIVVIILLVAIGSTLFLSLTNKSAFNEGFSHDRYSIEYNDGWNVKYNNTGETKNNVDVKTFNFKATDKNNKGVTFYKTLPSDCTKEDSIGFVVKNAVFDAYVDKNDNGVKDEGEELNPTHYYHGKNNYTATYWDYLLLDDSMASHNVYITFSSNSKTNGFVSEFYFGNVSGTFYRYYRSVMFPFFTSFALIFFCVILLLVSYINRLSRKQAPQLVVVSLFGVMFGIYSLFESGFIQIAAGNTIIFKIMSYLCLSISGWLLALYLYIKSQSMRFLRFARVLLWYFIIVMMSIVTSIFVPTVEISYNSAFMIAGLYATSIGLLFNSIEETKRDKSNVVFLVQMAIYILSVTSSGVLQSLSQIKTASLVLLVGSIAVITSALTFEYQFNVLRGKMLLRKQQEEQDTKVAIMLAQIQPHFLYNSLNSIAILCEINPKQAHDLTIKFSQYLRNNIDALSKEAPILFRTELRSIKNYLEIEKIRFFDKLNIVENIQVSDFYVPVLTIQPLVENAVKHGISKKPTPGVLMLTTTQDTNNYYVIIEDNGVGFDTSILDIKEKLGKSIGVSNVRYRLKSMVGGDVSFESAIGKGTKVTVTLPKILNKTTEVEE